MDQECTSVCLAIATKLSSLGCKLDLRIYDKVPNATLLLFFA